MANTTFSGVIRSGNQLSPGVVGLNAVIEVDPTQAVAGTGFILPKGSIVTGIKSLGGATGGTAPTIDVGISGTDDFFANELDADTVGDGTVGAGALLVKSTADAEVYAGVGAETSATGGTTTFIIEYIRT